jgi:hypothetical protein
MRGQSRGGSADGGQHHGAQGGWRLCGQRAEVFCLSGGLRPPYYATPAIRLGPEPWIERTLYLQIPKDAPGVSFPGEWGSDGIASHG